MDIAAYLRIIRPSGCLMVAATSILGQILIKKALPDSISALTVSVIAFTFTASSFVLNDYFDYKSDEMNSPWRPIPSGRITRNNALNYAILLFFVGSITSLLIFPAAALVAFITFIATTFYTFIAKSHGLIGNILVALIIPSSLIFGAFTISLKVDHLLAGIFLICFLYVLGGELAQSIADAEGDKIANVKSITLVKGPKTAAILASACYIMVAIIGAFTSFFLGFELGSITPILILFTLLMVFSITIPLLAKPDRFTALQTRRKINLFAFIIILIFFYLIITSNN